MILLENVKTLADLKTALNDLPDDAGVEVRFPTIHHAVQVPTRLLLCPCVAEEGGPLPPPIVVFEAKCPRLKDNA